MIDQAKRRTLKNVAAIGVSAAAFTASSTVLAHSADVADNNLLLPAQPADEGIVNIHIAVGRSSTTNDLDVVITNTSTCEAAITNMTPAEINTVRGRFDFNALFESGELRLAAGKSVSVPIQHHAVVLDGSPLDDRAAELTQILRRTASFITNGDSFAATTIAESANIA